MTRKDQQRSGISTPSPSTGEGRGEGEGRGKGVGGSRLLTGVAKRLRQEATDAERILWREVRAHRFAGFKFKRQEPLGLYVVDFVCYEAKLIVELDGGHHADQQESDAERTHWLESRGFRVLRFWNNDVLTNIAGVMYEIEKKLPLSPPLSRQGRGRFGKELSGTGAKKEGFRTSSPSTGEGEDEEETEKGKQ